MVLDGKIVALDEKDHPRSEWLINRGLQKEALIFYAFDHLKLGGVDLRGEPLAKR